MVECPLQKEESASLLLDYCDRALGPDLMDEMERHMAGCVSCREAVAAQKMVWAALDAWDADPVSMDFDRKLYEKVKAEKAESWWQPLFRLPSVFSWKPVLSLVAACAMLVGVMVYRMPNSTEVQFPGEKINVEQVENTLDDMDMLRQLGVAAQEEPQTKQTL